MTTTSLRWKQDGESEHGTATYFSGMSHEVTVTLPTFEQAHALSMCIHAAIAHHRWDARRELLRQIGGIEP